MLKSARLDFQYRRNSAFIGIESVCRRYRMCTMSQGIFTFQHYNNHLKSGRSDCNLAWIPTSDTVTKVMGHSLLALYHTVLCNVSACSDIRMARSLPIGIPSSQTFKPYSPPFCSTSGVFPLYRLLPRNTTLVASREACCQHYTVMG